MKKKLIKSKTQWLVAGVAASALVVAGTSQAEANTLETNRNWTARSIEQIKADIEQDQQAGHRYEIRWGDTLGAIAQATDISVTALAEINDIADIDMIFAGNCLYISQVDNQTLVTVVAPNEANQQEVQTFDVSSNVAVSVETPVEQREQIVEDYTHEEVVFTNNNAVYEEETVEAPIEAPVVDALEVVEENILGLIVEETAIEEPVTQAPVVDAIELEEEVLEEEVMVEIEADEATSEEVETQAPIVDATTVEEVVETPEQAEEASATYRTAVKTRTITPNTEYQTNGQLAAGETVELHAGAAGYEQMTVIETYRDNAYQGEKIVGYDSQAAKNRLVEVGTGGQANTTQTVERVTNLAYETVEYQNSELVEGERHVIQDGVEGTRTETINLEIVNHQVVSQTVTDTQTIDPVQEIIEVSVNNNIY